jgi:dynein assembly factor 1
VEGLEKLTNLSNLQLKRNRIGSNGLEDVQGLLACPSISALDISDNKIESEDFLPEIVVKMPHIAVLYMQNNEFTKKVSHYRKTVISKIPAIKYIDDKPVFEDELRYALAWARGGLEEERKERALYKKEKEDEQIKQHEDFRKLIERYKEEGRREKERAQSSESDSEGVSRVESLETYKSPLES